MLITLNNGKTVDIPFSQFDSMNDREWNIFMDSENGDVQNDPFYRSQLTTNEKRTINDDEIFEEYIE